MPSSKSKNTKRSVVKKSSTKKSNSGWRRSISLNTRKAQLIVFIVVFGIIGGSYMLIRSFAATPCRSQVLQIGSRGECVRLFQNAINVNQPYRLAEDGNYGSQSALAASDIQRFWSLTVDGKAGPKTADALCYGLALNHKSAAYCNGASAPTPSSSSGGTTTKPNVDKKTGTTPTVTATCSIGAAPTTLRLNQSASMSLDIVNKGTTAFTPQWTWTETVYAGSKVYTTGTLNKSAVSSVPAGRTTRINMGNSYKNQGNSKLTKVIYTVKNAGSSPSFSCSKTITLAH